MNKQGYDAVVVGAGQAGLPLAITLANAGWRVALVERRALGGTCVNDGCTPTKTMVASARVAYLAREAARYGVETGPVRVDLARVRERKEVVVARSRTMVEGWVRQTPNLELVRGEARFVGERRLEVALNDGGGLTLEAERMFINTGLRPRVPPVEGLSEVGALDSTSIMELAELPAHLIVLGGGVVGVEFAQMFRRFGAQVTLLHHGERLLEREDPDVSQALAQILVDEGISVRLNSQALHAQRDEAGLELRVRGPHGEAVLRGSHLLVATGRVPNTEALALERAEVRTDARGFIKVNERLETSAPGVYALGDVNGGPAFTHVSYDDFRILRANLLGGSSLTTEGRVVPYAVFTDPQLGRVGLTEGAARAKGYRVRVAKLSGESVARAVETGDTRGFMKAVVDADTEQILGCAMLGTEGGEVMSLVQLAMQCGTPYTVLRDGVFTHPTYSEALNNLFMRLDEDLAEVTAGSSEGVGKKVAGEAGASLHQPNVYVRDV